MNKHILSAQRRNRIKHLIDGIISLRLYGGWKKSNKISGLNHQFKIFTLQISFDELNPTQAPNAGNIQTRTCANICIFINFVDTFTVARRRFIDKNHYEAHTI